MNPHTEYEKFTQKIYQELNNAKGITIKVEHNKRIAGKSGQKHQIDVYWEYKINGVEHKVIIECKNYNSEVSIGKVRDFFGVLYDLTNVSGIMVTKVGYQKGAMKFAASYGINLKVLRSPDKADDCIVGRIEINFGISCTSQLFSLNDDWAREHGINWQSYRSRMSSLSGRGNDWGDDYLPLETTKDANIIDEKGRVIETLDNLVDRLSQEIDCSQNFENAYVYTSNWGKVKIKSFKLVSRETNEMKVIGIEARNMVEAILKDALSDRIMFFMKQ